MDANDLFFRMSQTIATKLSWNQGRRMLYDGTHTATMMKITKDPEVSRHVKMALDWPRIAVDYLSADCSFDGFSDDEFGATKLLVESGGDAAITSAVTNSQVQGVAFIAIIPRDTGLPILVPFSAEEATGIRNARGDKLAYGLAVKKVENMIVSEWYMFEPGAIHVLDAGGNRTDTVDLGVDVMPLIQFSYDPDTAYKPFGKSRISNPAISALNSALRNKSLQEQVSLINLLKGEMLMVAGQPDKLQSDEYKAAVGTLKLLFFNGVDLNGLKLEHLDQIELTTVRDTIDDAANDFASAMSMLPTSFGVQPSNGSFSSDVLKRLEKPYNQTKNRVRLSYGASIKLLAIELFKLVAGTEDVDGLADIQTVFNEEINPELMGSLGDAVNKITGSAQQDGASGATLQLDTAFLRRLIGMPIRPDLMKQPLPNLEAARARFREIKIDGV